MLMIALDLLLTIYQGALLIYVMKKQFVQRPHSILYEVSGILSFTFFLLLIQYLHLPIPDSLAILIPFLYIKCTSHERLMTCVLWTLLDGFLFLGTLTLVSSLFDIQIGVNGGVLAASDETQMIYNFAGNAALTVVFNIAARFGKVDHIISFKETFLFILMLLLCFMMNECFFIARLSGHEGNVLLIGSACSFVVMILTMVLYERLTETTRKQRQSELEAQTARLVTEHQEELKGIYKNMLAEQHDLRHRVAAAEEMLSSAMINDEDRRHVLELLKKSDHPKPFITGNVAVDAILKAKSTVMENAGIAFEFVEYSLTSLPISEQNFCMLLGNLLDNAIEGVMRLPASSSSRGIRLAFSKVWSMLFITCTNDVDETKLKRCGEDFLTTKEHPELHGFGTKSMKKIVAESGGTIEFEVGQGKFTVHIMLAGSAPC